MNRRRPRAWALVALAGVAFSVWNAQAATAGQLKAGQVSGWGWNNYGQLDNGFLTDQAQATPERISLGSVTVIGAGQYHSLATRNNGTVWAWGHNSGGQLGDGTTTNSSTPLPVLTGIVSVAAGRLHTLALRSDGSVWAWGANFFGQLGRGTQTNDEPVPQPVPGLAGIAAVGVGELHSL